MSFNQQNYEKINYKKVYILHFPKGVEDIQYSQGEIISFINENKFLSNYFSEKGSSEAPIIN